MTSNTSPAYLKSVLNFRDAGGIKTTDGKRIREKMIFRSAHPDKISKEDIIKLNELNIRTIIDLRADYERGRKKKKHDGIETVSLLLDFEKTTRERLIPLLKQKNARELIPGLNVSLYLEILDGSVGVFRKIVELLLDPSRTPLLIHCQAGKDRTGVLCALIQLALDAEHESIINNYLASNDALLPHFKRLAKVRKILSLGLFPTDNILYAITVRDNNMKSVIDRVTNYYGGIEGYLNLSGPVNSEIKLLKERFVI
jgi:protein-tyrosine phosphatase